MTAKKTTEKKKPMTLTQKMFEAQRLLKGVEQDGYNSSQKFKFASHVAVKKAVHKVLNEVGILFMCSSNLMDDADAKFARIGLEMSFHDTDSDDVLTVHWVGSDPGRDDKGIYVAQSMALKYALISTFLIPTGDEVDGDNDFVSPPQTAPATPAAKKLHRNSASDTFSEMVKLRETANEKPFTEDQWGWLIDTAELSWLQAVHLTSDQVKDLVEKYSKTKRVG